MAFLNFSDHPNGLLFCRIYYEAIRKQVPLFVKTTKEEMMSSIELQEMLNATFISPANLLQFILNEFGMAKILIIFIPGGHLHHAYNLLAATSPPTQQSPQGNSRLPDIASATKDYQKSLRVNGPFRRIRSRTTATPSRGRYVLSRTICRRCLVENAARLLKITAASRLV